MMGWGFYPMMGGWSVMSIITIFLLGIVIYAVIKIFNNSNNMRNDRAYDNPLDILNQRLVRGEIDEEEYKRKKELLLKR